MEAVEITPRNASFAKTCPQRVQLDVLQPCEPLPDSPFLQKLIRAGEEYEGEAFGTLFDGVEGVVVVEGDDPDAREWHTMRALESGALLVAGGRLPVDHEGHRVGEPDLLVRHGDGYLPVDVKSHKALERVKKSGAVGTALVSSVSAPTFDAASVDVEFNGRRHVGDALQLAHYWTLLECAGFASPWCCVGGILGTEGVIVWQDLSEAWMEAPEYLERPPAGPLSPLGRYELEFAHRLGIYAAAEAYLVDDGVALLAEPVVCEQCDLCRWRDFCGGELESVADLSLVSGIGVATRRRYKSQGVNDLHDLAALDWRTADLFRCKVDVLGLLQKVAGLARSTPLGDVIGNRPKQVEALAAQGFRTVGDLDSIHVPTFDVCVEAVPNAAVHIELARARVGAAPAYRRRGVDRVEVLRADVEVDVDMESTNDGCYLWGALITDRRGPEPTARYVSFATWDPDIEAGELDAFDQFWSWFTDQRARALADGASFRAYCYSRSAEQRHMTRLADALGLRAEVDEFIDSAEWVDLLEVVRAQLVTGRSMGLKEIAPLAGFRRRGDDGNGTLAMVKYDIAVDDDDPEFSAEAQQWILDYNEDDVRATAALREWLDGAARAVPSIETAAPLGRPAAA